MTFAINCGLVSRFLQELWKSLLVPVEGIPVIHEAVFVAVFTRLNHRSTWTANGIGAEAVYKEHALLCELIDSGGGVD